MKCELGTPVAGPFLGIQWDYVRMGALAADETLLKESGQSLRACTPW